MQNNTRVRIECFDKNGLDFADLSSLVTQSKLQNDLQITLDLENLTIIATGEIYQCVHELD